jgi:hypothetical protein
VPAGDANPGAITPAALVLVGILVLLGEISYSTAFGSLDRFIKIPGWQHDALSTAWLVLRVAALLAVIVLWILNYLIRRRRGACPVQPSGAVSMREDATCCRTARVESSQHTAALLWML